jgi:hypothetical protein
MQSTISIKTLMRVYISSLLRSAQTHDVVLMRLHYRQATTVSRKITTNHAAALTACRKIEVAIIRFLSGAKRGQSLSREAYFPVR